MEPGFIPAQSKASKRQFVTGLLAGIPVLAPLSAIAQTAQESVSGNALLSAIDPQLLITGASVAFAIGAGFFCHRLMSNTGDTAVTWSRKVAKMEARLEQSESILASHPGLVMVWDDALSDITKGWGKPRMLGGPAALASLLTFAGDPDDGFANPADVLLTSLGDLPLEEDVLPEDVRKLKDKVIELRAHGVAFSGSVVTDEGRSIEVDGRVAGDLVTLWLTDPAVRLAEDGGVLGKARDRAADLHGALNQLDRLPMASWRRNAELKLDWVNQAYVEMVEAVSFEEVIENQIEIDPAFRNLAQQAQDEFARSGRRIVDDIVVVNIRGIRRVLRILETPLHHAGDASLGGMAIDITKQDKLQEDLKRHQAVHRSTLDKMPSAVAVFNTAQQLDYYNQSFLDLWALDDSELRTRPSHGEILDRLRQSGQLPEHGDFSNWKSEHLSPYTEHEAGVSASLDGSIPDEIWNLPNAATLRVARQRHPLGGMLVVFEDITENLKLETQYNTQISVQRASLNNLVEGVAVFSADGKLRLFNSAFAKLWRFEPADLSSLPGFDTITAHFSRLADGTNDAWKKLKRRITSFTPEDRDAQAPCEIILRDGRTFSYATAPLPDGDTLVTFLDVTDSREREKELEERNQWLEAADKVKTKFVNHISYHLRNPLNTIIGFSEMLETEMFGTLNERQKDYAASILTASNNLLDLINDIIDLAAIDAGKLDLNLAEVNIHDTLQNAATYAGLKAEDSRVELSVECDEDIGLIVADEKRVKQVLFNLLANAFSFTDEGGKVTLGADRDGDTVRIWVKDTGRGISPEDQAKTFDRFESRGVGAGAGLGLSLVKSFIELHGGWVRLSSKEGQGTTIGCHLPAAGPAALETPIGDELEDAVAGPLADDSVHAAE